MEKLEIDKEKLIREYNIGDIQTKKILETIFGKKTFEFDYHTIKTYEDACKHLGIDGSKEIFNVFNERAMIQANAVYRLITICDAINNGQKYDEKGTMWYPIYYFYTRAEIEEMGEEKRKEKGIKLLSSASANASDYAGVLCAYARGTYTTADWGFPLCLTSLEKALYVAEQFEDLIFQCYGIEVKEE